jgi:dTDP-glucose 4,6-dehydratase
MKMLVTGGAGFIGSAVVRLAVRRGHEVVNLDALTHAGCEASVAEASDCARYRFEHADIRDRGALDRIFSEHRPNAVLHLAAETHVDRSIDAPADFITINIVGTYNLLEAARAFWEADGRPDRFRFHHVSTDEVFGSLGAHGRFDENSRYLPRSPYSASKASSDHLVRAWGETYGLPVSVSNCSNNYGPFQSPDKFVPVIILNALARRPIPVYGDGGNVRDWLYVEDHAEALLTLVENGPASGDHVIGGNIELRNLDLVERICAHLDIVRPSTAPHRSLITFVADRPGHDRRYAVDASRIEREFGWRPSVTIDEGLARTVDWYIDNQGWCAPFLQREALGTRLGTL